MTEDVRLTVPQIETISVTNATLAGTFSDHLRKAGPCTIAVRHISGATGLTVAIAEGSDGANVRIIKDHITGTPIALAENQAIQLPLAPTGLGVFCATGGTWAIEVDLHF